MIGFLSRNARSVIGLAVFGLSVGVFSFNSTQASRGNFLAAALDFRALYCAGLITNIGKTTFYAEPLRSCEKSTSPKLGASWEVIPAPYPGYALAIFAAVAHTPYIAAKAIWLGMIAASIGLSAIVLSRLTSWPIVLVILILTPTALMGNLFYGSTPAFALLGFILAAAAVSRGRIAFAAPALAITFIDPHIALPTSIAFVLRHRRAFLASAISVAVLIALSLFAIGISGNIQYLREALPLHAAAEIHDNFQYSLTHLLAITGVPDRVALSLGTFSYLIMIVISLFFAKREPETGDGPARAILIPAAAVCLGGTFIHYQEITLALPSLFLLAHASTKKLDKYIASAAFIGLLYSPFVDNFRLGLLPYVVGCAAAGAAISPKKRTLAALAASLAAGTLALGIHTLPQRAQIVGHVSPPPKSLNLDGPSSLIWAQYLAATHYDLIEDPRLIAIKIPTWLGLIALLTLAIRTQKASIVSFSTIGYSDESYNTRRPNRTARL